MRRPMTFLFAIGILCLVATSVFGASFGRWNVPGTPAQYFGYGYGPGHHAPMVRYPCHRAPSPRRLVLAPANCYPHYRAPQPNYSSPTFYACAQRPQYGPAPVAQRTYPAANFAR